MRTFRQTVTANLPSPRRARSPRGFSLVEIALVVGLIGVAAAFAVPTIQTALVDVRANAAARALQGHLRTARDAAVGRRRVIEVRFTQPSAVYSSRLEGTQRTPVQTTAFEGSMRFHLNAELPDTPDALGANDALNFDGADVTTTTTTVYFQPDGSMADSAGLPISGTAFLGDPQKTLTARAVTVLGPTGRTEAYRWDGVQWRKLQ